MIYNVLPQAKHPESRYTAKPEYASPRRAGTSASTTWNVSLSRSGSWTLRCRCVSRRQLAERTRRSVAVVQSAASCCSQSMPSSHRRPSTVSHEHRCRRFHSQARRSTHRLYILHTQLALLFIYLLFVCLFIERTD